MFWDIPKRSIDMAGRNNFRRGMIMPTLITQIKSILEQYPDDGQILKEIIQNAEDAGASKVVFVMDHSTYGTDPSRLHHPDMVNYQGPALLVYNNASFTEKDWKGIRTLHESVKADDPLKVGKFGLGFKSVFHMTDLPSIYSGRVVGFLDPHTRFFEVSVQGQSRPEKTTSYCWDFEVEEDFEEVRKLSHLFQPFLQDIFGTNEMEFGTENFEGTMFRFPLRNNTMHSDLSSNCYDGNKIKQLLNSLEAESDIIFLFLKNIKRIEFYEKINGKTTRLLDIKIPDNDIASVNLGTTELAAHINSNALNWYKKESKSVSYRLPIEVTKEGGGENKLTTWMVTQHFGGASSRPSAEQSVDGNLPLVGIASKSIGDNTIVEPYGQIFCFMPLPQEEKSPTGFYFHVHGSFAVDQNRRHLKWMSADQDPSKITDKDLIWNNFLLEKLLPVCLEDHYKCLISDHKLVNWMDNDSLNDSAEIIYKILPDEEIVNHHWMKFVSTFMKLFRSLELFSITTSTWRSRMSYILNNENDEITNLNLRILTKSNFDLARLPKHLVKFISKHEQKLSADCICMNLKYVQQNISCTEHEKIILLKFFLKDLSNITALQGIQLLPLHDGSWIQFEDKFSKNKIFIFNKQYPDTLFPGLKNQFLSPNKLSSNLDELINNFNFQQIDKNIFSRLLRKMLSEFVVDEIRLGSYDWFNYEWLASVWTCLKRDFHDNLSIFSELHLILVSTDKVVKLTQKPTIIGTSLSDKTVEQHFRNICHSLGIIFVETHQHNEIYNHPCLWDKIILPPRMRSILKFLMPKSEAEYIDGFDKFSSSEIDYFVASIVSEITRQPLTSDEINILKKLKIFKTINGSGKQDVKAVSLSSVNVSLKNSAPHCIPVPSCIQLVDLSKISADVLAKSLSIRLLCDDMYLKEAYIQGIQRGFYTGEEVQLLMKHVCTNFRNIPTDLITELKRLSFITRGKDGLLSRPQDLFDHKDETLINLLDSIKFPCESWKNPDFHWALINLGLKGVRDITSNDCFEIINNIAGMSSSEKSVKSKILLNFMNKNSHLLDESLKLKIKDINWIKINKSKPSGYPKELKYLGEETDQEYARYNDVISPKFENISGSTCLFTECKNLNVVGKLLGWNESPSLHLILKHFKNIIDTFHLSNKLPNTEVYEILDSFTNEELVGAMDHEFPWVWTGNEFVPPRKIVINRPKIDLKPYIFTLPVHLQQFKNLWKSLNISLNADLIECLSLINDYHETSQSNDKERVDQDLNLAVNILNSLADCGITTRDPIFVPIQTRDGSSLRMKPIEQCAYCDKNWFQRGFDIDDLDSNTYLINEKIPMKIAEKLQIASCLGKLLNVEEFQCNWGQEESLTTRLKNILKEYTDGLTVLKELVQNADDAGATEISFVYDERRNEDSRTILLDENMKEVQGAAIWCHNNAVFSEDDFKNITKLGGETKHLMSTKIGKFGLGFNSVYNLTDVPMFYSNDSVVIFDPHRKYLGKLLNNRSPGIRLRLIGNHQKVSRLKDQFAPFNGLFGCDFTQNCEHYPGTLFRLPLRTQNQANKSELIKKHYSRNEVIQLFECLMKSGEDLLLFTQSLCKIKFYHIDEDSIVPNMTEIYNVSRTILNVIENAPMVENTSYLKAVSKQMYERANNEFMLLMEIKETFNQVYNFGSLEKKDEKDKWIVSWCTGAGESFDLYLKNKSYLPIGSVAAKFSNNNDIELQENFEGKFFCFLPLPSTQSLPVHVNGYFALNSSRTHIHARVKNDKIDDRCIWNEELLKDAVTMAYCNLIRYLALKKDISDHYCIFPRMSNWGNNQLLVESLYSKLVELNLKVFRSIVDYNVYGYSECRIVGGELQGKCFSESVEKVLVDIAKLQGNKVLIKLSSNIYDCLRQIDYKNNFQSKVINMKEFYEDWFIPNLERIDESERETIIMETLIDARLQHFLVEHVCIPVTPRGESLESIGQLVDPESPLAPLYDNEDQMFPFVSKCMENKKRIYFETLIRLGMRTNTLNEEEIIDRCHSIEAHPQSADTRLPILLDLIEYLLKKTKQFYSQQDEKLFLHEIKYIKMFPGKLKPEKFPLFWKQESPCLTSCIEGFLEIKMLVAASSNIIIDEDKSFKGNYQLMKSHLELEDKCISFESLKIVILEIEKHFDENENYSIKQDNLAIEMTSIIHQIYCEIKQMNKNNLFDQSSMSALSKMRLILTNSQPCRLLSPDQCRKNIHRSLLPHMCGVNETSLVNVTFMQSIVGIKDCFLVDDFVQLLKIIESSFRGVQLVNPTLDLVFRTIECLLHELQFGERPPECFLPNKLGVLCLSSKLKYNDCNWMAFESSQYCHDNISFEKAKKLGIISVRKNHLDCYRLPFPFGQKEELVNRINRILTGYPLKESIFKEMLQNADDAMATEIHFINDSRHLSTTKIFCNEWEPLQGPALCIYNDKSFTLNDLKGIQKLGEGSKQNDITKTGQYGVGFNCVYHLTDVPSFLTTVKSDELKNDENISGTVLAIFDPNCAFLPKSEIDVSNPGALYSSEVVTDMFTDVYEGYLQDIKTYNVAKSGTIFRLPLRNEASKSKSKIEGEMINSDKNERRLKDLFKVDSHLFLLFLKSLESIHIVSVSCASSSKLIQNISLNLSDEARTKKDKFMKSTKELALSLQNKTSNLREINSQEVIYELEIQDSNSLPADWIIVQRFGFEDTSKISHLFFDSHFLCLQPIGGVAFNINNFDSKKYTSNCKIFNFLPLPVNTNLPVHINGHFVLNHEDRRGLWKYDDQSYKTEWNKAIISQIIAPAYCSFLSYMKQRGCDDSAQFFKNVRNVSDFYGLFPKKQFDEYVNLLVIETYKYIHAKKLQLFMVYDPHNEGGIQWTCVDEQIYFDDLDAEFSGIFISEPKLIKAKFLRDHLYYCGMKIIVAPIFLWKEFQNAGFTNIKRLTRENVYGFISSSSLFYNLPQSIKNTPFRSVEGIVAVLEYIADQLKSDLELLNLPFLLNSNEVLNKATEGNAVFESKYCDVAPHKSGEFVHLSVERFYSKETKFIKRLSVSDLPHLFKEFINLFQDVNNLHKLKNIKVLDEYFGETSASGKWLTSVWNYFGNVLKDEEVLKDILESKVLKSIHNLCIIPVTINDKKFLYPICKRSCVLRPLAFHDETLKKLFLSLKTVGTPSLDVQFVGSCKRTNILKLFGNIDRLGDVLMFLEEVYINLKLINVPNEKEGLEILKYFSNNCLGITCHENGRRILCSLPFYIDMNGCQVIPNFQPVYVVPVEIPTFDTRVVRRQHICLKDDYSLRRLFELLKFKSLTVLEAYALFLFDAFKYFTPENQLEHLKVIRRHASISNNENDFMKSLKNFEFIVYNGQLRKASYFYDKTQIFKIMETHFLPEPFDSFEWRCFVVKCGLNTELCEVKFLEYAHKISSLNSDTYEVQLIMIDWLAVNINKKYMICSGFLEKLKTIPFMYPLKIERGLLELHPKFNNTNHIHFQNSVLQKDGRLCWTISNILPQMVNNRLHTLFDVLNVTTVDSNAVLSNLRNISDAVEKKLNGKRSLTGRPNAPNADDIDIDLIKQLTEEHLMCFHNKTLGKDCINAFKNIKCLYIDDLHALVRPNQVVTDITSHDQIRPYIIKFPNFYGKFEKLLMSLGATKEITVEQCARSLEEIKDKVKDQKVDPNNKGIAQKLFKVLLKCIEDNKISDFDGLKQLFLPCKGDILCDSKSIYCSRNFSINCNTLSPPVIVSDKIELLFKLPKSIRPMHLDKYISVEVVDLGKDITVGVIEDLKMNLKHPNFLDGLLRIKLHSSESSNDNLNESDVLENLQTKLKKLLIFEKETISVHHILNAKIIEKKNVPYFVKHDFQKDSLKIYVTSDLSFSFFTLELSEKLACFFNIQCRSASIIDKILTLNPLEIDRLLDMQKIGSLDYMKAPPLGTEIQIEDHFRLVQDFILFHPQQLVAYEIDDPFDRDMDGDPKYMLVEIIRVQGNFENIQKYALKYEINCGSHKEVVPALKLFAFETICDKQNLIILPSNICGDEYRETPTDVSEVIEKLKIILKEIWKLEELEKKKAIKRLYLTYHPDKNLDNRRLFDEIFKHLKILIDKLENGQSIDNYNVKSTDKDNCDKNNHDNYERRSDCRHGYFERMNRRANQHCYTNNKKGRTYRNMYGTPRMNKRAFFNDFSTKHRKDPYNAELWMKQARHDAEVAMNDLNSNIRSSQWVCIKFYQAIKNAITAVNYAKNAGQMPAMKNNLKNICSEIYDQCLDSLVEQADKILVDFEYLAQPRCSRPAFENITKEMADDVEKLTKKILSRCDDLIAT